MKIKGYFGLFFLTALLLFLANPVYAANCGGATDCNCGDTLTSSWTMSADLNCMDESSHGAAFTDKALTIDANNVTLDCAGHSLIGYDYNTIMTYMGNSATHSNITITDCNIFHAGDGIYFIGSSTVRHEDINIHAVYVHDINGREHDNVAGLATKVEFADRVNLSDSNFFDINVNGQGASAVTLERNTDVNILRNKLYNTSSEGIYLADSNYYLIADNNVWDIGISPGNPGGAALWVTSSNHGVIQRNRAHDSSHMSLTMWNGGGAMGADMNILDNNFHGNSMFALDIQLCDGVIVQNNFFSGVPVTQNVSSARVDCIGGALATSSNVLITDNNFYNCSRGVRIFSGASNYSIYNNSFTHTATVLSGFANGTSFHDNNILDVNYLVMMENTSNTASDVNIYNIDGNITQDCFYWDWGVSNVDIHDVNLYGGRYISYFGDDSKTNNVKIRDSNFSTFGRGIYGYTSYDLNFSNLLLKDIFGGSHKAFYFQDSNTITLQDVNVSDTGYHQVNLLRVRDMNIFDSNFFYNSGNVNFLLSDVNNLKVYRTDIRNALLQGIYATNINNVDFNQCNIYSNGGYELELVAGSNSNNDFTNNYWGFSCPTDSNFSGVTWANDLTPVLYKPYPSTVLIEMEDNTGDNVPDNGLCWGKPDLNIVSYTGWPFAGSWFDGFAGIPPYSYTLDNSLNSDINMSFTLQVIDEHDDDLNIALFAKDTVNDAVYSLDVSYASLKNSGFCSDTDFTDWTDCTISIAAGGYDANWQMIFEINDSTYDFNSQADSNLMFESSDPYIAINDFNWSWQNVDSNIMMDANDLVNMDATDSVFADINSISYRIDTDCSDEVTMGSWQTAYDINNFTFAKNGDGNWAIDFNVEDRAGNTSDANRVYLLIDSNSPEVSISAPTAGETISSQTVTLEYSGTDANSGVAKYWVSADGSTWTDNGTNTEYSFTSQSNGDRTYHVIATDNADNNSSDANVAVTVSFSPDGGSSYHACAYYTGEDICTAEESCPGSWLNASDTSRCCSTECLPAGEQPPEPPEPELEEELFEQEDTFIVLDEEDIGNTAVNEIGIENFPAKRLALSNELLITRHVSGKITKQEGKVISTAWDFRINVKNVGSMAYNNISIIEKIPKEIADHVSKVIFVQAPVIKEEDPIVEWAIDGLEAGEDANFNYSVGSLEDESILEGASAFFSSLASPTALVDETAADRDACKDIACDDSNPCTEDYCIKGKCYHSSRGGLSCGDGLVCEETVCVAAEPSEKLFDWTLPIVLSLIVLALVLFALHTKRKR